MSNILWTWHTFTCAYCGLTVSKRGADTYCSRQCAGKAKSAKRCVECGAPVFKILSNGSMTGTTCRFHYLQRRREESKTWWDSPAGKEYKRYLQSEEGKKRNHTPGALESKRRYNHSKKGKRTRKEWRQSEKGIIVRNLYRQMPHVKEFRQRYYETGPINPKDEMQWLRKATALLRTAKRTLKNKRRGVKSSSREGFSIQNLFAR